MRLLITGAAGFIASHLADRLLKRGDTVVGIDNFDPYYEPAQKWRNIEVARSHPDYAIVQGDIRDAQALGEAFDRARPDLVIHLAARAGVRTSLSDPFSYAEVNELGGLRVLMECQHRGNLPLLYASTSSVYGKTSPLPFSETDPALVPLSPYAASKRAGELMARTFHEIHGLSVNVLRFFTVYGPRGRPDMAFFKFTEALLQGHAIQLHGELTERDFTYVDDIVDGVIRAGDWLLGNPGFYTFNLGRSEPVVVRRVIELLARALGKEPRIELVALEPGEAFQTAANVTRAQQAFGYFPRVSLETGVEQWLKWLRESPEAPKIL